MRLFNLLSCLLCFFVLSAAGDPDADFNKGVELAKKGNIGEAALLFENYLAHQLDGEVSIAIINAHTWLTTFDKRKGKIQEAIDRNYHILELVEEANKRGLYRFKVDYPNDKIFYLREIFSHEWTRGRLGQCAEIYSKVKPALAELMEVADPVKNRTMWLFMMPQRKYGKWMADHMEIYLLIAAGKQQETVDKYSEIIQTIEIQGKGVSLSEGNKMMLQNMCSIQAGEYSEIGRFDEALERITRAGTIHFVNFEFLNSTTVSMRLDASLVKAKRDGVAIIDRPTIRDAWRIIDESNRPGVKIGAKRCIAELLQLAGKPTEALSHINDAVKYAREAQYSQWMPKTLRLRAAIHLELGDIDAAEKDILEAMDIMRTKAMKYSEASLYQAYGRILSRKGLFAHALQIWESGIVLCKRFNKPYLYLDILCDIMDLHLKQGAHADAWKTWERIQKLLKKHPDIQPYWRKRLPDIKSRYDRLKGSQQNESSLLERKPTVESKSDVPAEDQAEPNSEDAGARPKNHEELYIQPSIVETRVRPGESANARFQALNLSANAREADLSVMSDAFACEWEVVSADTVVGKLTPVTEDTSESTGQAVTIPAGQVVNIFMTWKADQADAVIKEEKQQSIRLAWDNREESFSEWVFGLDSVWRNVVVVDASLVENNAFLYVPFYHSIYFRDGGASIIDLQAKALTPCRIEIYEEGSNEPLALDANGDGDFLDEGDAVFSDNNGNNLPDLNFDDSTTAKTIEIWVFPVNGNKSAFYEEVEVMVSAGEQRNLQLQAVDKLIPATGR